MSKHHKVTNFFGLVSKDTKSMDGIKGLHLNSCMGGRERGGQLDYGV